MLLPSPMAVALRFHSAKMPRIAEITAYFWQLTRPTVGNSHGLFLATHTVYFWQLTRPIFGNSHGL